MAGEGFEIGFKAGSALADGVAQWRQIQRDRQDRKEFEGAVTLANQRRAAIRDSQNPNDAKILAEYKALAQRYPQAELTTRPVPDSEETEEVIRTPEGDIPLAQIAMLKTREQQRQTQVEIADVDLIMEIQARYPSNPYVKQWSAATYAGIQQKQQIRAKQLEAERIQADMAQQLLEREKFAQERREYEQAPERERKKTTFETDEGIRRDSARIDAQKKADLEVEGAKGTGGPSESDISGIRKEFSSQSGDFTKVRDAYSRIKSVAKDSSPAGDLALVFSFIRVLDPGSTVREGEFATAENTRGIPDTVRQKYNKIIEGEPLSPGQRKDFISQSKNLYSAQLGKQRQLEGQYRSLAERRGMNPQDVVLDYVGPEEQEPAAGGDVPDDIKALLEKY